MTDDKPETDLNSLQERLDKARGEGAYSRTQNNSRDMEPKSALGLAFRVGVELVSAVAVGLGIGWLLDYWLDTKPWLMLVFIILGGCAGILNVYRMARGYGYAVGYQRDETRTKETDRS